MVRRLLAALSPALIAALALTAYAQTEPKANIPAGPSDPEAIKNETVIKQEIQARQFKEFEQALLRMAQRLEKSAKVEDREKAATLRKAIELSATAGVDNQFARLVTILTASKTVNIQDVEKALGQNEELVKVLREMLTILLTDDETRRNKEEQERIKNILKELGRLIKNQKVERAMVESGKGQQEQL